MTTTSHYRTGTDCGLFGTKLHRRRVVDGGCQLSQHLKEQQPGLLKTRQSLFPEILYHFLKKELQPPLLKRQ
jgi:hypothetical protein